MSQSVQTSNTSTRGLQQLQALMGDDVKLQKSSNTEQTPGLVIAADGSKTLYLNDADFATLVDELDDERTVGGEIHVSANSLLKMGAEEEQYSAGERLFGAISAAFNDALAKIAADNPGLLADLFKAFESEKEKTGGTIWDLLNELKALYAEYQAESAKLGTEVVVKNQELVFNNVIEKVKNITEKAAEKMALAVDQAITGAFTSAAGAALAGGSGKLAYNAGKVAGPAAQAGQAVDAAVDAVPAGANAAVAQQAAGALNPQAMAMAKRSELLSTSLNGASGVSGQLGQSVNADLGGQSEYAEAMSQSKLALLDGETGAAETQKGQGETMRNEAHQSFKEIIEAVVQALQSMNRNIGAMGTGA